MVVKVNAVQFRKPPTQNKNKCKGVNIMRKEPIFTRSFITKLATVLGFNPETAETETETFPVSKKIDDEKILEYIRKNIVDEKTFVPVKLLSAELKTEIRGIKESVFYANSFPMESRHNAEKADSDNN